MASNSHTAKQQYDELAADDMTPLERLRFFCSLAMNGQDWLDVEPFFDALAVSERAAPAQPCVEFTPITQRGLLRAPLSNASSNHYLTQGRKSMEDQQQTQTSGISQELGDLMDRARMQFEVVENHLAKGEHEIAAESHEMLANLINRIRGHIVGALCADEPQAPEPERASPLPGISEAAAGSFTRIRAGLSALESRMSAEAHKDAQELADALSAELGKLRAEIGK